MMVTLLVALLIFCVVFWACRQLLAAFGIGEPISTVVQVVFVLVAVLWLLSALGGASLGLR